jgi:hypothetical protein
VVRGRAGQTSLARANGPPSNLRRDVAAGMSQTVPSLLGPESVPGRQAHTLQEGSDVTDWLTFGLVLAAWWLLQAVILPRMGVPT